MSPSDVQSRLDLLSCFAPAFTAPTFPLFVQLASAWVLCPGRHTLTRLYSLAEPKQARAHDAYHRFFGRGAWLMAQLWRELAAILIEAFYPQGPVPLDLAQAMLRELATWFPERCWRLAADGAYASLAKRGLPRCELTSRMRRDAALYELPPQTRRAKRGRPRKKGRRLPTPEQMAKTRSGGKRLTVNLRGKRVQRLAYTRQVLWYEVCQDRAVLLVICRDPEGKEPDDFYFTTDLAATATQVIEQYGGRWSIEDTFRNVKQYLGGQDPQVWKGQGPERASAFAFWMYAVTWAWHLHTQPSGARLPLRPWYRQKARPSFADALAALRRCLWHKHIFAGSQSQRLPSKIIQPLLRPVLEALAYAA